MDNLGTRKTPQSASSRTLVRVASRSDLTAIASLLLAAFTEFRELYTPEAFASTVQPESGILARMEEGPVGVAEKGSALVGTASAIPAVEHLMVREEWRFPRKREDRALPRSYCSKPKILPGSGATGVLRFIQLRFFAALSISMNPRDFNSLAKPSARTVRNYCAWKKSCG